jgi:nitrogen fixation/metabolism regulation signal transduction histidine kinase
MVLSRRKSVWPQESRQEHIMRLEARQEGDHIVLIIADDGRGMSPERIRAKAIEKASSRRKRPIRWMIGRA